MTQICGCLNCGKDYDSDTQGAICPHESGERRRDSLPPFVPMIPRTEPEGIEIPEDLQQPYNLASKPQVMWTSGFARNLIKRIARAEAQIKEDDEFAALRDKQILQLEADNKTLREQVERLRLNSHKWVGRQMGGNPANAESYEWVRYCDYCGAEDTCEEGIPECPVTRESLKAALAEHEKRLTDEEWKHAYKVMGSTGKYMDRENIDELLASRRQGSR